MASRTINIEPYGQVSLLRRKGQKNISLRVSANGQVKISYPWLVPQAMALRFLESKSTWVLSQQEKLLHTWQSGNFITPSLKLFLVQADILRPTKKVSTGTITLTFPYGYDPKLKDQYIDKKVIEEQKSYIEKMYLPELKKLAEQNDFKYKSARVKALKSRWGSCSSHGEIVLNAYLAQLSHELIEYVLVHELAHTKHLNHSPQFWSCVESILSDYKARRKALRSHSPAPRPYSVS